MTAALLIHEFLCIALFYTVFCRAVHSDARVKTDVRFAFFMLGVMACMGMVTPLVWQYQPGVYEISLLASVVLVQAVTAYHWQHGVPEQFVQTQYRARHHRKTDHMNSRHV